MFAVAALQTTRSAPELQAERSELISRVQDAEADQDELRSRASDLTAQIGTLRAAALGDDGSARELEARIDALDPVVGTVPVTGPGVLIVVDDAPVGERRRARPGARPRPADPGQRAVAGGGRGGRDQRPSAVRLTAIRSAGDAITVDYRSLTRPYRVEAIGDPRTLQARFVESPAGVWWNDLAQNRRMRYEISDVKQLDLAADPGIVLRHAKRTN